MTGIAATEAATPFAAAGAAGAGAAAAGGTAAAATGILGSGISTSTALGLGTTALTTGLSMFGRMAGAGMTNSLYIQNAQNQNRALAQNYNGIGLKQSQISDKAQSDNFDILRGLAQAKGKAVAAAGEAGVGGVSFANVLSDLNVRDAMATGNTDANYQASEQNAQNEKDAAKSRTDANIASLPQANNVSLYAGLGADAATGALKIYDTGKKGGLWGSDDVPTGTTSS